MSFRGCFRSLFHFYSNSFSFRFATKCCYVVKKTLLLFFKSCLLSIITIVSKRLFDLSGVLFHAAYHAFPSKFLHRFSLFFDVDRLFRLRLQFRSCRSYVQGKIVQAVECYLISPYLTKCICSYGEIILFVTPIQ